MQDVMDGNTGEIIASRGEIVSTHMIAFWAAFKKAIAKLPPVIENDGKGHNSKYATYAQSVTIIRPILLEEDFIFVHGQTRSWNADEGGGSKVRLYDIYTDFVHVPTGLLRRSHIEIPVPKLDAQAAGSALTYGKRYTLLAGLGIATADDPVDDDGQRSMPNRLNDDFIPSDTYIELRDELEAIEKKTDLSKWFKDKEKDQRLQRLTPQETGSLKTLSRQKHEKLSNE